MTTLRLGPGPHYAPRPRPRQEKWVSGKKKKKNKTALKNNTHRVSGICSNDVSNCYIIIKRFLVEKKKIFFFENDNKIITRILLCNFFYRYRYKFVSITSSCGFKKKTQGTRSKKITDSMGGGGDEKNISRHKLTINKLSKIRVKCKNVKTINYNIQEPTKVITNSRYNKAQGFYTITNMISIDGFTLIVFEFFFL